MLFSSILFLYCFLPAVLVAYFLAPKRLKNAVLLLFSLAFYAWGEKHLVLMLILAITLNYFMALLIEKYRGTSQSRYLMLTAVAADLGMLAYYKYADFFLSSFNTILRTSLPLLNIALPIGISFYTFQIISYVVDVYRGSVTAQHSFVSFAAYVSLFPQLIAGPIVRYADIAPQLEERTHSMSLSASGVRRFIFGLGKKVILANTLGEITVYFRAAADDSTLYFWLYAISYMLQIYYDFSGYSDMAIGLGKIFGFTFPENFSYPYIASSVTEFWRRWHISLGSWFRDYVYIPLGGNRRGLRRQLLNILVVWMLTGLWHGASWNFVLWGLYYGFFLMLEKLFLMPWLKKCVPVAHLYTLLVTVLGFVLFNANSLSQAVSDWAGLAGMNGSPLIGPEAIYYLRSYGPVILIGIVCATPLPEKIAAGLPEKLKAIAEPLFLTALLLCTTAFLVDGSFNPFLYFRF